MADSLTTTTTVSTIPSGTVIATDDAGASGHVQLVKLTLSADGSATPITADANGMEVQGAGTAGTPAGGVVSVQGVASGTVLPVGDNSGSLTVDAPVGTPVFVRLSDGSAAISTLPVSAASLPLPSGAATSANQSTVIGHLDGVETLLGTIDADTGTLAGAVSGTEMQVDIVAALPAGTNAIGKLAANSGVDIGDVDITSIAAGDNNIGNVDIASYPSSTTSSAPAQTSQGTTAAQVLAANSSRKTVRIANTGTTILYFNEHASTEPTAAAHHFSLPACFAANDGLGGVYVSDVWKGAIRAVSSGSGGTCVITELT